MKVILTIKNIASGPFYLVSGKLKVDKYRFVRVPTQRHLHQLVVDIKKAPEVLEDLALRTQQSDIPVSISFEVEDSDLNSDGALSAKDAIIAERDTELAQLRVLVRNAEASFNKKQAKGKGAPRITETELEMLKERDEMLLLLGPVAKDDELPLAVLQRVLGELALATAPPTSIEPPREPEPQQPPAMAESEPAEEPPKPPARKRARKTTG